MVEGLLVGTIGTVLGSVLGLLVCYLQIEYQLFPLDPTVYIIPAIPVEVRWTDFIAVCGRIHAAQFPCIPVSGAPRVESDARYRPSDGSKQSHGNDRTGTA